MFGRDGQRDGHPYGQVSPRAGAASDGNRQVAQVCSSGTPADSGLDLCKTVIAVTAACHPVPVTAALGGRDWARTDAVADTA